jgi:isocitrate dehydrogenase (NAD+)
MSDGLFLDVCSEVANEFPDVKFDNVLLDRACLHVCIDGIHAGVKIRVFH